MQRVFTHDWLNSNWTTCRLHARQTDFSLNLNCLLCFDFYITRISSLMNELVWECLRESSINVNKLLRVFCLFGYSIHFRPFYFLIIPRILFWLITNRNPNKCIRYDYVFLNFIYFFFFCIVNQVLKKSKCFCVWIGSEQSMLPAQPAKTKVSKKKKKGKKSRKQILTVLFGALENRITFLLFWKIKCYVCRF